MKTPMAYYLAGAALIACSLLWFFFRNMSIRLTVNDIKRRLEENGSLHCILALFNDLPLCKLWEEDFKFDNYAKTLIKDASSLSKCLQDIRIYLPDERKREIVLELLTESMDRAFSTEDLAKIYADCVLKNIAQKMTGLEDIFTDEKRFIGLIITKKHLTRDIDQRKDSFRARVLRILENSLIETANQSEKVSIRAEMEIFKNSPLPTHEEDETAA